MASFGKETKGRRYKILLCKKAKYATELARWGFVFYINGILYIACGTYGLPPFIFECSSLLNITLMYDAFTQGLMLQGMQQKYTSKNTQHLAFRIWPYLTISKISEYLCFTEEIWVVILCHLFYRRNMGCYSMSSASVWAWIQGP